MVFYDFNKLNDDIDVIDLCSNLGIKMRKKGPNRYDIICPEHNDRHYGNCILTDKGYHCFACGAHRTTPIEIAKTVLNLDFLETVDYLLKNEVENPNKYYLEEDGNNTFVEFMPFEKDEIALLDLNYYITCNIVKNLDTIKSNEDQHESLDVGYLVDKANKVRLIKKHKINTPKDLLPIYEVEETLHYNLGNLWEEDKEGFLFLIENKVLEKFNDQYDLLLKLDDYSKKFELNPETIYGLRTMLRINLMRLKHLYNKTLEIKKKYQG